MNKLKEFLKRSLYLSPVSHPAGAYLGFYVTWSGKEYYYSPLDGMPVPHKVPPPPAFHQASLTFRWNTFILLAPVVRCVNNPIRWIAQYVLWILIRCIVIHHRIEISILWTTGFWLERNTVKVKCFAQKHNTMTRPARSWTQTSRPAVQHANHQAPSPPAGR